MQHIADRFGTHYAIVYYVLAGETPVARAVLQVLCGSVSEVNIYHVLGISSVIGLFENFFRRGARQTTKRRADNSTALIRALRRRHT
jgi:hypothetical protein